MAEAQIAWPEKTREIHTAGLDSTRWNDFAYRAGDIIIATPGKTGTTWVQQIVAQLIFEGADAPVGEISAWLERVGPDLSEVLQSLKAQPHRRFLKTHLPVDALGLRPDAQYIFIARDGRDAIFSAYEHVSRVVPEGGLPDVRSFFVGAQDVFLCRPDPSGGNPLPPMFPTVQSWWNARHLPNVLLVHYNHLKADMPGEIRRIAGFLKITPSADAWPKIVEHCSFGYMKQNAGSVGSKDHHDLRGGPAAFFHAGVNGRWRDVLTAEDIENYERLVAANLTPDCAHWLATGEITN